MAKLTIRKYQDNRENSVNKGSWYGRLQHEDTIGTSELCRHIAKHGSIFTSDVVKGVVEKFVNCFEELLLEGYKLKLDGLGTFYLSIKTKAAPTAEDFTAQNVKAVRVKFLADQSKESEYTTRILTQKAKFRSLTDSTDTSTGENGNVEP